MGYKIISSQFDRGTDDQKAAFIQLFGQDHIQYKFDFYFHWYNIVHEYGHCLLDYYNGSIGGAKEVHMHLLMQLHPLTRLPQVRTQSFTPCVYHIPPVSSG